MTETESCRSTEHGSRSFLLRKAEHVVVVVVVMVMVVVMMVVSAATS